MARNKKNNIDDNAIILVFAAIGTIAFAIIEAILYIVFGIIKFIHWCTKKANEKGKVKTILREPFKDNNTNYRKKEVIDKESILIKLDLFNMDTYNYIFLPQIRPRGEEYFELGKVKYFRENGNKYTCKINGTKVYNVSIIFDENDNDKIKDFSCTCPFHIDGSKGCKHIYALLYKIKCSNNKKIISDEIDNTIKSIEEMVIRAKKDFKMNSRNYKASDLSNFENDVVLKINEFYRITSIQLSTRKEDELIKCLIDVLNIKRELHDEIERILDSENDNYSTSSNVLTNNSNNYRPLFDDDAKEDMYDNPYGYTKEQLEHLEPWQLELVKKGEYDPSGFEEQEPEDDDWHSDDEDETVK